MLTEVLPRRIQKEPKRASRWKSPAHRADVRRYACCMCGSTVAIECAHVRLGSGAGIGQKPDDWRTVPLCGDGGCHARQHALGEETFWREYEQQHGQTVDQLLEELCAASPRAAEIRRIKAERANG